MTTMPDVLIRDVPKKVLDGLKKRAKQHGRSLQQELREMLRESGQYEARMLDFAEKAREIRERIARYAPVQTDSTELIRQDRER
jgi:plasmid stability protein